MEIEKGHNSESAPDSGSSETYTDFTSNSENDVLYPLYDDLPLSKEDFQGLSVMSCFMRNKLSVTASKDIVETFRSTFPEGNDLQNLSYQDMWKVADKYERRGYIIAICVSQSFWVTWTNAAVFSRTVMAYDIMVLTKIAKQGHPDKYLSLLM